MQAVNGAWAVLGDPDARASYDAELGIVPAEAEVEDVPLASAEPVPFRDLARRFLPLWILLALLAAIFLFTAYAGGPPPS